MIAALTQQCGWEHYRVKKSDQSEGFGPTLEHVPKARWIKVYGGDIHTLFQGLQIDIPTIVQGARRLETSSRIN